MSLLELEPQLVTVEVTEDSGLVTVVVIGLSGPQGPAGTLIQVEEDGVVEVTPLRDLDFGTGFDVYEPVPRTARIDLDLSEVSAGGELGGTLDAPTVDASHSGSTHQSISDALNAHEIDVVDAHDASAISFVPTGSIVSADVQSAIVEVASDIAGGGLINGTPSDAAHTTQTNRWNAVSGTARMVAVYDTDTGVARWENITAVDVLEPAQILSLAVAPVGAYPDGVSSLALVASSGTDTPRFAATYQGTATAASVDIASHTYGGGRNPEVTVPDYPATIFTPFTSLDGQAINRGRAVGESVTLRESATVDSTLQTRDVTLTYVNERLWGVSTVALIDTGGEIDTFRTAQSKELSNARARTFAVTAGVGEYIYYLVRAALGTPTFTVGGFEGGFSLVATVSWTNPRGFAENLGVWRSDNTDLGATTVVVT